jgi:hypothetical protein
LFLLLALGLAGCDRHAERPARASSLPLPVRVLADSGRVTSLAMGANGGASAWMSRVTRAAPSPPVAVRPTPPGALAPPVPETGESLPPEPAPASALVLDDDLKPPIPRGAATLRVPAGRGRAFVELDVRVDESGAVSDALWAGGSQDSLQVAAAVDCALSLRYYPALQHGQPIAVWCRQRFEFGGGAARPVEDPEVPAEPEARH